jgi:SpoVK/Ycf46/Vps4 family AAA+-type ATPase
MNPIDSTIHKTLRLAYGYAGKLASKHRTKYSTRQKELASFFEIKPDQLIELRTSREVIGKIEFRNTMLCFEAFVHAGGRFITEMNFDMYNSERIPPVRESIETAPGVRQKILEQASVFFVWAGEKYCMDISAKRWSESGDYNFKLTAKDQGAIDRLMEVFSAYRQENHYLRGKKFNGVSGEILPLSEHSWGDLVWPDGIKEKLRSDIDVIFKNASIFRSYGLNSKKGFILSGEPGNGKTLLLKILAKETEATCIMVPFDEFKFTPYIFSLARDLAPTILILEDIDLFGVDRDNSAQNVELGKLMNQLDGMIENREIVVIATTNRLEKVEKALQNRPGRFDRVYVIPNPDFQTRIQLIAHFIRRVPNEISGEHVEILAEEFAGYSAAYLKELVNSGFAQAIIRDSLNPVLKFCDLESMVDILKRKKDKVPVGFSVPTPVKERSSVQNKREENL